MGEERKARVVVVGGGYGGVTVAKGLDPIADVTLVERNDQFVHHVAALRAATDDVWGQSIFMPYSYLLKHGQVMQGTVAKIEGHTVHLYGGETLEADYLVLATGSSYPFPAKQISGTSALTQLRLRDLREDLGKASKAVIVGGGTVGLELAGELADAYPNLTIEIVEKEDTILPTPGLTAELRHRVEDQLAELGVKVTAGSPLSYPPNTDSGTLGRFNVVTQDGVKVDGDIWFQCYGSRPATGYLRGTDYANALNEDETIRVLPTLQIAGHDYAYALGDVTDISEAKRADAARAQAHVVVANIAAQIEGGEPVRAYQPKPMMVVLPLGPTMGASQLFDSEGTARIVGGEQTAEIKGTDLMISVIRAQLGLP